MVDKVNVSAEKFYLNVGETILSKGAEFGLRPDGLVTNSEAEKIEAERILNPLKYALIVFRFIEKILAVVLAVKSLQKYSTIFFDLTIVQTLVFHSFYPYLIKLQQCSIPFIRDIMPTEIEIL